MLHTIESMHPDDWEYVARIYAQGIATGLATFETSVPTWEEWDRAHLESCRLVARDRSRVQAWAALSDVSDRCAYRGVAEVSVYVAVEARGSGIGRALLGSLIEASEVAGIWTLQAQMFADNVPSARLHESCGFRHVGVRERLGQLAGRWHDVTVFERRSPAVGT